MQRFTKHRMPRDANQELARPCVQQGCEPMGARRYAKGSRGLLLATTVIMLGALLACGGSGSGEPQQSASLSGNWQFTMAPQTDGNSGDPTFTGGLQGGFLLQNAGAASGSASGQTVYSVTSSTSATGPCNSGSAAAAVTISGQNVTITEAAGTQNFTLTGTVSADGTTMIGTYTSTAGTAADGSDCGYAVTGLSWTAVSVPALTGPMQGSFHSTEAGTSLTNQDFAVSGSLTQSPNIGASNATVTGTLSFIDPVTNVSDYPCFSVVSVNGQISGNTVILQFIGTDGSTVGQVGEPVGSPTSVNPVTFDSVQGGYILHGVVGPSYIVASKSCPGNLGAASSAGDSGDICLALNSSTACQQPITLSPASVSFPAQLLGSATTTQAITLTNNSSATLPGLTLGWLINDGPFNNAPTDFNGLNNFAESDNCSPSGKYGATFDLSAGGSCTITVAFSPQESCPWIPYGSPPSVQGASPEFCPLPLSATLTVASPASADPDKTFAVPITGIGRSALEPSTPELDFSAEEQVSPPEASVPQTVSFTNYSSNPVQILGPAPCVNPARGQKIFPHPLLDSSPVAGVQVATNGSGGIGSSIGPDGSTILYNCDSDPVTTLSNFQISSDTCTGTLVAPQGSCSLQVAYVPQPPPGTNVNSGLDFFLELNTVQCWPPGTVPSAGNPCEIDSGRFPVELRANIPSPLRMLPSAGLDFGIQKKGTTSAPLTVTLLNDPSLTSTQTVAFVGKISAQGNYSESDDCPVTLSPGSSCTLTVMFTPSGVGLATGTLTINYSPEPTGAPQIVYLRGTGQ
jgi:hypothetical protein